VSDAVLADKIYGIIRTVLDQPAELSPATTAKDVHGWDSLKHILIIVEVESAFDIRLAAVDVEGIRCVGDLVATVARKVATS
jgi:acyl carrier protein